MKEKHHFRRLLVFLNENRSGLARDLLSLLFIYLLFYFIFLLLSRVKQAYTKVTDSHQPAHPHFCRSLIHCIVPNYSASRKRMS